MTDTDDGRVIYPPELFPRLVKALEYVAEEPRRLFMGAWMTDVTADAELSRGLDGYYRQWLEDKLTRVRTRPQGPPPCGTTVCLAGSVLLVHGVLTPRDMYVQENEYYPYALRALQTLGLLPERYGFDLHGEDVQGYELDKDYPTARAMWDMFYLTNVATYERLVEVLEGTFVFPASLPQPVEVTA